MYFRDEDVADLDRASGHSCMRPAADVVEALDEITVRYLFDRANAREPAPGALADLLKRLGDSCKSALALLTDNPALRYHMGQHTVPYLLARRERGVRPDQLDITSPEVAIEVLKDLTLWAEVAERRIDARKGKGKSFNGDPAMLALVLGLITVWEFAWRQEAALSGIEDKPGPFPRFVRRYFALLNERLPARYWQADPTLKRALNPDIEIPTLRRRVQRARAYGASFEKSQPKKNE